MITHRRDRGGIAALALGTFVIGTDAFVVAGVLPAIARTLRVSVADAGLLVTAFALAYAIGAPVLTTVAAARERRRVLVAGMVFLAVANLAAALAPSYSVLLGARVVAAVAGGLYSPIALATAVQVSPDAERGRAVALVLAGLTVSLVVGVPLGSLLGALGSWRWTFGFVAGLAAACAIALRMRLPVVVPAPASPLAVRLRLLRRPVVVATLAASFLWITGAFAVYTFIAPVLTAATHWSSTGISGLLVVYGAAAFAGNHLGGVGADRWGAKRVLTVALASLVASLTLLGYATGAGASTFGVAAAVAALAAWASAGWALTPAQSHRLIELTPAAGAEVLSLNTSAIYFGVAAGAAVGGRVLAHLGPSKLGAIAAGFELLALVVVVACPESRATATDPTATRPAVSPAM